MMRVMFASGDEESNHRRHCSNLVGGDIIPFVGGNHQAGILFRFVKYQIVLFLIAFKCKQMEFVN